MASYICYAVVSVIWMFEFVHHYPESSSTLSRMAVTCRDAGYDAVVSRNHVEMEGEDGGMDGEDGVGGCVKVEDVEIYRGVEAVVDSLNQLYGLIDRHQDVDILAVHGGDGGVNIEASESGRVDVVSHPTRGEFNHVFVRNCSENDVAVEFNLRRVLKRSGGGRVRVLENLRKLLRLVRKYDTPYIISCDPHSHLDVRGRREIASLCSTIGFEDDEIEKGMKETPSRMVEEKD